MIRDNSLVEELFNWPNKEKLYNIIRKHEKSNVILLSGDVHFAKRYQTPCESLTGYSVPEYTSSGMTHSLGATVSFGIGSLAEAVLDLYSNPIYGPELFMFDFNFGKIVIKTREK